MTDDLEDGIHTQPTPPAHQTARNETEEDRRFADDTTAAQYEAGRDIQGIPWEGLLFTRERYRETRLRQYKNYENLTNTKAQELIEQERKKVTRRDGKFYGFRYNTRVVKCSIIHFQLRNLVWASSNHDVYTLCQHTVSHYSPLTRQTTPVLQLTGAAPLQHHHSTGTAPSHPHAAHSRNPSLNSYTDISTPPTPLPRVQVATITVKDNLLAAGGFLGEFICKDLATNRILVNTRLSHEDNAITNAIHLYSPHQGGTCAITANNDHLVRVFDMPSFTRTKQYEYPWPVNHTSTSPDGRLMCVVGDSTEGFIADLRANIPQAIVLKGHLDYSFASAWHPDGHVVATGNQDKSCRLWDVRYTGDSFAVLRGREAAIRSLRFTNDGKFLAIAEAADFVHVFDSASGYKRCQEIDLFGEIAGFSFSPDDQSLFIGIADGTYGSLLEFERKSHGLFAHTVV